MRRSRGWAAGSGSRSTSRGAAIATARSRAAGAPRAGTGAPYCDDGVLSGRSEMNFATLWRDSIGFWRAWVVTLGRRHGLLDSPSRVARGPLKLWTDAALALGVVKKVGRKIVPVAPELWIDRAHPDYLAGHLMYGALRSLDYDAFGAFFRRGRTLNHLARPRRLEAVEEATAWDHVMFLRRLPVDVRRMMDRGCDVLELGCGSGAWLKAMRRAFPRSRFTG